MTFDFAFYQHYWWFSHIPAGSYFGIPAFCAGWTNIAHNNR